jgi:hypothetical protein
VERLAVLDGPTVPPAADRLAAAEAEGLPVPLDLGRCEAESAPEAVAVEWWPWRAGSVAGLNVATESIAPATRQTARMLASSGMMVPGRAKGEANRRHPLRGRPARRARR